MVLGMIRGGMGVAGGGDCGRNGTNQRLASGTVKLVKRFESAETPVSRSNLRIARGCKGVSFGCSLVRKFPG